MDDNVYEVRLSYHESKFQNSIYLHPNLPDLLNNSKKKYKQLKEYLTTILLGVAVFAIAFLPNESYAISGTITDSASCAALGGLWINENTCNVPTLTINSGDVLTINSGVTMVIPFGNTVTNYGMLINSGHIQGYGVLHNKGTIENNPESSIDTSYLFTNDDGATLNNSGTITAFLSGGQLFSNSGTINNNSGSEIIIIGRFSNNVQGIITNSAQTNDQEWASILNSGTFTNYGFIGSFFGIITNTNLFTNNVGAGITNNGNFINECGATFTQNGFFTGNPPINNPCQFTAVTGGDWFDHSIWQDGISPGDTVTFGVTVTINPNVEVIIASDKTITSLGTIINFGTLNNLGTFDSITGVIDNSGSLNNSGNLQTGQSTHITNTGILTNHVSGVFTHRGAIDNLSTLTNFGIMIVPSDTAIVINNSGGQIINHNYLTSHGLITNNLDGLITNNVGANLVNEINELENYGMIENFGKITIQLSGGILNLESGVLDNNAGAVVNIDSQGYVENVGIIDNFGIITNNQNAYVQNYTPGIINNQCGGIINSLGSYFGNPINVVPCPDLDGDGFTSDVDCNDNNSAIYPNATEIPNDGIDQDCDGQDLVVQTDVTLSVDKDSFMRKGTKNTNEGDNTILMIQKAGNKRTLLSFDLSDYEGQQVNSATLRLYITYNGGNWGKQNDRMIEAHKLLSDWTEGTGANFVPKNLDEDDEPAKNRGTGSGVTWSCAIDTNISNKKADCNPKWDGGNFAGMIIDSEIITSTTSGWIEFDVTGDVNSIITGYADNFGWLIKKSNEGNSGRLAFASGEHADPSIRPQIVLNDLHPQTTPPPGL